MAQAQLYSVTKKNDILLLSGSGAELTDFPQLMYLYLYMHVFLYTYI